MDLDKYISYNNVYIMNKNDKGLVIGNDDTSKQNELRINRDTLRIFELMNGSLTLREIINEMTHLYNSDFKTIQSKVIKLIENTNKYYDLAIKNEPFESNIEIMKPIEIGMARRFTLELTDVCNLKCRFCYNESHNQNKLYLKDTMKILKHLKYLRVGDMIEYQQYMSNPRFGIIVKIYQGPREGVIGRVDVQPEPPYTYANEGYVANIKTNTIMKIFTKEENPELFL